MLLVHLCFSEDAEWENTALEIGSNFCMHIEVGIDVNLFVKLSINDLMMEIRRYSLNVSSVFTQSYHCILKSLLRFVRKICDTK